MPDNQHTRDEQLDGDWSAAEDLDDAENTGAVAARVPGVLEVCEELDVPTL